MTETELRGRSMVALGAALFMLGLLTGFVVQMLTNPRMGLSGHLEGVMNGTFLIAVGAVWSKLKLSSALERAAFALLVYGTFANWFFVMLGALWGTSEISPIAGVGFKGLPWQESVVTIGLSSVGVAMVGGLALAIMGFFRRAP
jgi:(hydroxyamino)benzene mutase